jgi:hypothetical protein
MSSATTLDDAFVIPRAEDLSALDFVIRLDHASRTDAAQRLVDDYVVTPAVAAALPTLFGHLKAAVATKEPYGHVLHGGFGSGKSHLMTLLSLLLERNPAAWGKQHPLFDTLRQDHRDWVAQRNLLVVRVHMLSARRSGSTLDETLYEATNRALVAQGKAPFRVGGVAEVLEELRREAADYGAAFWKRAAAANVAEGPEDLAAVEEAGEDAMSALAGAYLQMKGRTLQSEGLKPAWGEGLRRLAKHVKGQGFGGLVFLVDEFLLWLAEKAGEAFVAAINDMNTIVDFGGGGRDLSVCVIFARQRNIRDFFPDLTSQDRIQEHLDHHAERFKDTKLQDVELRHIVAGRVLRERKDPAAIAAAIARVKSTYDRALDDLVGEQGPEVLADVYPFHPALIDVLVDVSNLMQRERSALRLLYELLSHNRDLPLGLLVPVGRAFEHVFPPAGVEAAQKSELLQKIHGEWYQRLAPRLDAFVAQRAADREPISAERKTALERVLQTVLLGLVSPRLAGRGNERLTVERLVKLNFADADGEQLRQKILRTSADLEQFRLHHAPELQMTGEKGSAVVAYAIGQASLAEALRRAEDKVRSKPALIAALGKRLERELPKSLQGLTSSKDGLPYELLWRGTRRRGRVVFGNVREQPYAVFEPAAGESFRVIVDYPWDEPGHTVDQDIQRVNSVKKNKGTLTSAAWLPRHFSTQEERLLRELAAAAWLVEDGPQGELLASYGRDDRTLLIEQARSRLEMLQRQLDQAIKETYGPHAEVKAMIGAHDPDLGKGEGKGKVSDDLDHIIRELLDRRYPQHPAYRTEVTRPKLAEIETWLRAAWGQAGSVHYEPDTGPLLDHIARYLEIAEVGQSRAQVQHHGRFVKEVVSELGDHRTVAWAPIADKLRSEPFGLTDDVVDLLLVYVCLGGYRLRDGVTREPVEARVGLGVRAMTLEKAELLDLAPWSRARNLAQQVLAVQTPDSHRSLVAQDRLFAAAAKGARELRDALSRLFGRLDALGAAGSERHAEVKSLIERFAPLVAPHADSFQALTAWLTGWPDDDASLRTAAAQAKVNNGALDLLDTTARGHLIKARHGRLKGRIEIVLDELDERLKSREHVRPLRDDDVRRFNKHAAQIVAELIEQPPPTPPPQPPPQPPPPLPPGIVEEQLELAAPTRAAIDTLAARLRDHVDAGELVSLVVRFRRRKGGA